MFKPWTRLNRGRPRISKSRGRSDSSPLSFFGIGIFLRTLSSSFLHLYHKNDLTEALYSTSSLLFKDRYPSSRYPSSLDVTKKEHRTREVPSWLKKITPHGTTATSKERGLPSPSVQQKTHVKEIQHFLSDQNLLLCPFDQLVRIRTIQ